jgi:hypothetical protein
MEKPANGFSLILPDDANPFQMGMAAAGRRVAKAVWNEVETSRESRFRIFMEINNPAPENPCSKRYPYFSFLRASLS